MSLDLKWYRFAVKAMQCHQSFTKGLREQQKTILIYIFYIYAQMYGLQKRQLF